MCGPPCTQTTVITNDYEICSIFRGKKNVNKISRIFKKVIIVFDLNLVFVARLWTRK